MHKHVLSLVLSIIATMASAVPTYSQDSGRVKVEGGEIYYEIAGAGPAVVFIHGGFGDRRMWNDQFASFANSFRVIRYDVRGFGLSSTPSEPYSAVADLEALLDHLAIPSAHVVGNSMGASLALEFALLKPERTDRLVVVSNGAKGYPYTREDVESVNRVFRAAQQESLERAVELWLDHPMVRVTVKDPEAGPLLRQMVEENASLFKLRYWPGESLEPSAYDRLHEIDLPVLFVLGADDTPLVHRAARASFDRIPGAEWVVIPSADHLPQMVSHEFDERVLEFLATPAAGRLTISVSVPTDTPPGATVYVACTFNGWNPAAQGYELRPGADGLFSITLPNAIPGAVEFKFTLGSWDAVETDANGGDVPNRSFTVPADGEATYSGSVTGWRDPAEKRVIASTAGPNVSVLNTEFVIPQLERSRRVRLYLPPDYATSNRSYPVLYLLDGQNVFDEATSFAGEWGVDETLDRLYEEGSEAVIVVAVDNGGEHRLDEYSPYANPRYGGGEGDAFLDFLVKSLKPFIDANYRTLPNRSQTGIMGSSMGGLISLYAVLEHPDVFGRAGVFSPALWFAPEIFEMARSAGPPRPDTRIYIVSGALEGQAGEDQDVYVRGQQRMAEVLASAGFRTGIHLESLIRPDGRHAEWFWRREFPAAYDWLFMQRHHD